MGNSPNSSSQNPRAPEVEGSLFLDPSAQDKHAQKSSKPRPKTCSKSSALSRRLRCSVKKAGSAASSTPQAAKVHNLISTHGQAESYFQLAAERNPHDFEQIRRAVREEVAAYQGQPEVKAERRRARDKASERAIAAGGLPGQLCSSGASSPDTQGTRSTGPSSPAALNANSAEGANQANTSLSQPECAVSPHGHKRQNSIDEFFAGNVQPQGASNPSPAVCAGTTQKPSTEQQPKRPPVLLPRSDSVDRFFRGEEENDSVQNIKAAVRTHMRSTEPGSCSTVHSQERAQERVQGFLSSYNDSAGSPGKKENTQP